MESTRQQKVARLIQKEFGEMIQRDLQWIVSGSMVTVTVVRVSPDLSFAKLYLSVFGAVKPDELLKKLEDNKSKIRYAFGQRVRNQLRIVPEFAFFHDDSASYAAKIDSLLNPDSNSPENEKP
jgi:ribosome-binding factor A